MDDRWGVKTQCRLERSAAECRQAISCYLAKKSAAVDDWNVVASTISCIIEAISTGVYVPGWIAYTVTVLRDLRSCTMTNPLRGRKSRSTVTQVWRE